MFVCIFCHALLDSTNDRALNQHMLDCNAVQKMFASTTSYKAANTRMSNIISEQKNYIHQLEARLATLHDTNDVFEEMIEEKNALIDGFEKTITEKNDCIDVLATTIEEGNVEKQRLRDLIAEVRELADGYANRLEMISSIIKPSVPPLVHADETFEYTD